MDVLEFSRRQRGLSLLESLVALVVLSIGMLGIGSMLLESMRDARGSMNRSKAVALANDMAERIRSNIDFVTSYSADWSDTGTDSQCDRSTTVASGSETPCAAGQRAAHDIYHWKQSLADPAIGLPLGNGQIVVTPSGSVTVPATIEIHVRWWDGVVVSGTPQMNTLTVVTM